MNKTDSRRRDYKEDLQEGSVMMGIIIALISGALMSVQGVFNTGVTEQTSIWVSNSWVQFSALIVCLAGWLLTGRGSFSGLLSVEPGYLLLGGAIGAFITFTVIKSMDALGPAKAVMLIVIMQIISAYVIELLGLFGSEKANFSWGKIIGALIGIVGVVIFCLSGQNNTPK